MGLIILPDDAGRLPDTFADDYYLPDLKNQHVTIVAQLPAWADVRWYRELARRARHEVKSAWVVRNWRSVSVDIRDAADRCIRDALITISDTTKMRLEVQANLENRVMKRKLKSLPHEVRQYMEGFIDESVEMDVLFDSPAYPAMRFADGGDPDMRKLRRKLGSGHNVRIFGARSAAALAEYLDGDRRRAIIEQLIIDKRYILPEEITALFMADAVAPNRTFDEGNTKVVNLLRDVMEGVADRIRRSEQLILPAGSASISEGDSKKIPHVAAADIAAGIAGDLYEMEGGLRKVIERFRMVILNGEVVKL